MSNGERIYRRTEAGTTVTAFKHADVPTEYRRILRLMEAETHSNLLRKLLRTYPESLITQWLRDLETLGLIESLPAAPEHDLDFTDNLKLADLAAAFNKGG